LQNICITTAFPTTTTSGNNAKNSAHTKQNKTPCRTSFSQVREKPKKKNTHTHTQSEEEEENNNDNNKKKKETQQYNRRQTGERESERARRELGKKHRSRAIPHVQTVD
jgi:hypothetical protein